MMTDLLVKDAPVETARSPARRVLVAEDSPITHDLLKLLLNQRGLEVDIATDGLQALAALRANNYDVALLDFHLPQMNGLQVAATIKAEAQGRRVPRLIAITADPEGLLSNGTNCENFDRILPKPLDITEVGRVVEEQAEIADRHFEAASSAHRRRPGAFTTPSPSVLEASRHGCLTWPDDLEATPLTTRANQATAGDPRFDAVVVKRPMSAEELATIWQHKALFALPVIDLTGSLGTMADLDASRLKTDETNQIARLISRFQERRKRLHRDILLSDELADRLLGRIFVTGRPLTAILDPASHACVSYNVTLGVSAVAHEAEGLCNRGLLQREFVERFHVCARCDSARLHVRNGCPSCRSSNLRDEKYLHHFRCGFHGARSDFRRGLKLICPKCQHELTDFGIDYEQTATMSICQSCGHADAKSVIGMVCLDCSAFDDWGTAATRDAFSYELTDQGSGFAEYGRSFLGLFQKPLRFDELPRDLVVALNAAAKQFNSDKTPFTLVNIFYKNERRITAEFGVRQFDDARDRFIENLQSALGGTKLVVKGPSSYDFALLPQTAAHEAERDFKSLRERATAALRLDIGATLKAFGPEDF